MLSMNSQFPTTQILLNSTNYNKATNSFIYNFNSDQPLKNHVIAMQSAVIYNQFYNISSALGNNTITVVYFPSGASAYVSKIIMIPDGFYDSPTTFSSWLQLTMLNEKYCTTPTSSTTKYFIELGNTTAQYAFYLKLYSVQPSDTPPSGASWSRVSSGRTPKIQFGKCGSVWGFDPNTIYGEGLTATTTTNSPLCPQIRDSTTIIMTCNLCNNGGLSFPTDFLYSLRIGNEFGSAIVSNAIEPTYNIIQPALYRQIVIRLYDQNMKPLSIIDPNIMFLLLLKQNTTK